MNGGQTLSISARSRLQRLWDWYTDLGFGAWLLAGGLLAATVLVIGVIVSHGAAPNATCDRARPYVSLIDKYDGLPLTPRQAAQLHHASTRLQAASDGAVGEPQRVLAGAARTAGSARAGRQFDAGFASGRFQSVCDFSGPAAVKAP